MVLQVQFHSHMLPSRHLVGEHHQAEADLADDVQEVVSILSLCFMISTGFMAVTD